MEKEFKQFENKVHGRIDFPYAVYMGLLPEFLRTFPLHWHQEFEIIWIKSGQGYFRVQSQEFLCSQDDILIIPPGVIHSIRQKDDQPCAYFNILFKFSLLENDIKSPVYQTFFNPFENSPVFTPVTRKGEELNQKIIENIKFLVETRRDPFEKAALVIKSRLFLIMNELHTAPSKIPSKNKTKLSSIERLKPLLIYISENYESDISVEKAAEMTSLSPSHFMKFFKASLGITFVNYLNQVRIENAQILLKNSDLNVSEICEKCGFHNLSYFIRTFKKAYGVTPKKYHSSSF